MIVESADLPNNRELTLLCSFVNFPCLFQTISWFVNCDQNFTLTQISILSLFDFDWRVSYDLSFTLP